MDITLDVQEVPWLLEISCCTFGVLAALCVVSAKLLSLTTDRGGWEDSDEITSHLDGNDDDTNTEGAKSKELENEIRNLGFVQFLGYGVASFDKWHASDVTWGIPTATSPLYDVCIAGFCAVVYFVTSTRKCSLKGLCNCRSLLMIGGLLTILGILMTLRYTGIITDEINIALVCTKFSLVTIRRNFKIWRAYSGSPNWIPTCMVMDILEFSAGFLALFPLIFTSVYFGSGEPWYYNYPRVVVAIPAIIVNLIFLYMYHLPSRRKIVLLQGHSERDPLIGNRLRSRGE